jgi:hypothetical protein
MTPRWRRPRLRRRIGASVATGFATTFALDYVLNTAH